MSRFSDILEQLKKFDVDVREATMRPIFKKTEEKKFDADGSNSEIYFRKIDILDPVKPSLEMALSMPKNNPVNVKEAFVSRRVMHRGLIHSPFVLPNLYSDMGNRKISVRAKYDLADYLKAKKQLTLDEAKKLLGQLVLVLYELHKKNVVHRDLSIYNVFVTDEGDIFLGDNDSAVEVHPKTGKIKNEVNPETGEVYQRHYMLTPGFSPRELWQANGYSEEKDGTYRIRKSDGHLKIDVKAAEIYSFGRIVERVVAYLPWDQQVPFGPLIWRSTNHEHYERPYMQEIMEDTVWGKTPEDRVAFFKKLNEDAIANQRKKELASGEFLLTLNPEEGDAFNFMSSGETLQVQEGKRTQPKKVYIPGMKDIYAQFERLQNQIDFLNKYDEKNQQSVSFAEIEAAENGMKTLIESVDTRLTFLKNEHPENTLEYAELDTLKASLQCLAFPLKEMTRSYIESGAAFLELQEAFDHYQKKFKILEAKGDLSKLIALEKVEKKLRLIADKLLKFSSDDLLDSTDISKLKSIMDDFFAKSDKTKHFECLMKEFETLTLRAYGIANSDKPFKEGDVFMLRKIQQDVKDVLFLAESLFKSDPYNEAFQKFPAFKVKAQKIINEVINPVESKYFNAINEALYQAVKMAVNEYIHINKLGEWTLGREHTYRGRARANQFLQEFGKAVLRNESFEDLVNSIDTFRTNSGHNGKQSFNTILKEKTEVLIVEIRRELLERQPPADDLAHQVRSMRMGG